MMSNPRRPLDWFSRHLIEILPAAVYVCDTDAVVVAFNHRATELWGRTPTVGQTDEKFCGAHRLFRPDGTYLPHSETPMEWVLRTGETARDQEVIIERPDGSRVAVLVNIAPLFDDDGRQIGAVNCFQDLSAQKASEREREQLREQLHQAQKMEAVGQLTGGLAHDFNNILTGILGSLEILQRRISQGRIANLGRYINAAQDAAKRAAALTHRLLAFSRRQSFETKLTDANSLVAGLDELIRGTIGSGIAVEIVLADGLWNALIDPNQLENALLNLCINARDAMPNSGLLKLATANVNLDGRLAAEYDISPGQYISLSVSDSGVGMTPDVLARACEPFYTTKPTGSGTGLGLSMIYGFARQSGGHAAIISEPGKGTTVCLYLPRHFAGAAQLEAPAEQIEALYAKRNAKVLIVDDEPTVRLLIAEALEDLGYSSIEASDAAGGLRALKENAQINLLITDVGLPGGKDGRQLAAAARDGNKDLKVLFISGYAAQSDLGSGVHILTKPFTMSALAERINEILALSTLATSGAVIPTNPLTAA